MSLLWNYPQLFYIRVKFYNTLSENIIIKNYKGILNITTSFPGKSTGIIDLYIPESAVITFYAVDFNQNRLLLNNLPNISVGIHSVFPDPIIVTRMAVDSISL